MLSGWILLQGGLEDTLVNIGYSGLGIGVVGVLFNSWMGVVELEIVGVLFSSCVGVGVLETDLTVSMWIGIFNTSPSLGLYLQHKKITSRDRFLIF